MSGHSKWHSIKHKKAIIDAKRGKVFTRVIKELQIAARMGGSDPAANPRLRTAVQAAKDVNMPKDTMERAIKKGAGELEGEAYEELLYEGYGPGGVAIMVQCTTDNKNRTAADVRHAFQKCNGNLGQSGCVAYLFDRRGVIEAEAYSEDAVMEAAIEAGALDVASEEGFHEVTTEPDDVQAVREALEAAGIKVTSSGVRQLPNTRKHLSLEEARAAQRLIAKIEEIDDVDEVYANYEVDEEVAAELGL